MKSLTKVYDNIGTVLFERSKRAIRMNITIRPFKGIRVAVPFGVTFKQAEKLILSKTNWIVKHLNQIREREKLRNNQPIDMPMDKAKEILNIRVAELAEEHGFTYNRVSVKRMTSRWGSCSTRNNINLNIKLLHLPEKLCDYVILHELVHTIHKNHGPVFWKALSEVCVVDNPKDLQRELTKISKNIL
ncbi:MAG: M48 family metallopeptidase [Candidatus Marinimicrobia bacterium]|nr:M48 family metallopeptidase [Candidatus Neomarinimicrobiota bacterium]